MSGLSALLNGLSALFNGLRVLLLSTHVQRLSIGLSHNVRHAYSHANKASEGPKLCSHLRAYALTTQQDVIRYVSCVCLLASLG